MMKPLHDRKKLDAQKGNFCKEPYCEMKARCKGYCSKHYEKYKRKKDDIKTSSGV